MRQRQLIETAVLYASILASSRTDAAAAAFNFATDSTSSTDWPGPYPGITFEELRPLVNTGSVFLLDVRNRSELLQPGRLPNSLNLPLPELDEALNMPPDDFQRRYGFQLPAPAEREMVLTCRSGRRVQTAAAKLVAAGYDNLRLYYGSFNEWVRRGAPVSQEIDDQEVRRKLGGGGGGSSGGGLVLDVRSAKDRDREGGVTASWWQPLSQLDAALRLPSREFKEKFGFDKPALVESLTIIGGGKDGTLAAIPVLNKRGYCNLGLYLGPINAITVNK